MLSLGSQKNERRIPTWVPSLDTLGNGNRSDRLGTERTTAGEIYTSTAGLEPARPSGLVHAGRRYFRSIPLPPVSATCAACVRARVCASCRAARRCLKISQWNKGPLTHTSITNMPSVQPASQPAVLLWPQLDDGLGEQARPPGSWVMLRPDPAGWVLCYPVETEGGSYRHSGGDPCSLLPRRHAAVGAGSGDDVDSHSSRDTGDNRCAAVQIHSNEMRCLRPLGMFFFFFWETYCSLSFVF